MALLDPLVMSLYVICLLVRVHESWASSKTSVCNFFPCTCVWIELFVYIGTRMPPPPPLLQTEHERGTKGWQSLRFVTRVPCSDARQHSTSCEGIMLKLLVTTYGFHEIIVLSKSNMILMPTIMVDLETFLQGLLPFCLLFYAPSFPLHWWRSTKVVDVAI